MPVRYPPPARQQSKGAGNPGAFYFLDHKGFQPFTINVSLLLISYFSDDSQ